MENKYVKMNTVKYDDISGGRLATQYLVNKGHRRIAFCAATVGFQTVQDRFQGYKEIIKESGIEYDQSLALITADGLENWKTEKFKSLLRSLKLPRLYSPKMTLRLFPVSVSFVEWVCEYRKMWRLSDLITPIFGIWWKNR